MEMMLKTLMRKKEFSGYIKIAWFILVRLLCRLGVLNHHLRFNKLQLCLGKRVTIHTPF
jgi:hypothetical protein